MTYREILNIERFEMMEERLGIRINSINAEISDSTDSDGECSFNIRGEVLSLNGGNLDKTIILKISLYDSLGKFTKLIEVYFFSHNFFGIDVFESNYYHKGNDIDSIRILAVAA